MKFDKIIPTDELKPYIKYFMVSENEQEHEHKVLPSPGLVIGFQYKGHLSKVDEGTLNSLDSAGITGISDSYNIFRGSANIGTILVFFTETGFSHFAQIPANELFNLSLSLDDIFDKRSISEVKEQLADAAGDKQRITVIERFLLSHLKHVQPDKLVAEAIKLIYRSKGIIRISELNQKLFISRSPFEKRFRKIVGTTPKKFSSIVRLHAVLDNFNEAKSLIEICYENNFFDQAHFIKDFKKFTGDTPEHFKRLL